MEKDELEFKHEFLQRFITETGELTKYCDEFITESEKWSFLFPSKSQKNNEEIIEISTKEQFKNTKTWICKKKNEFEIIIKKIENDLPINSELEENCRKEILESFNNYSEIHKAVTLNQFNIDRDKDLKFCQIGYPLLRPKNFFQKISYIDCSSIWFDDGREIAFGELKYLISEIIKSKKVKRINVQSDNAMDIYSKIESTINLLKNSGYNPSTIFIPSDVLHNLRAESRNKESKIYNKFSYQNTNYIYDVSTRLEIIISSKFVEFKDIIISDKKQLLWTFNHKTEDKRLNIEIKECEDSPSNVEMTVKTVLNLKIIKCDSIKIIELPKDAETL